MRVAGGKKKSKTNADDSIGYTKLPGLLLLLLLLLLGVGGAPEAKRNFRVYTRRDAAC